MTRLQLALDILTLRDGARLLSQVGHCVDILEAGTPWLLRYGAGSICDLRRLCSKAELLCDAKIMDAGEEETRIFTQAGANWVTVMAATDAGTIRDCVRTAHSAGARVMADLLGVDDITKMVHRLEDCGVDCIAVHVGVDRQARGETPLQSMEALAACHPRCLTAVAGGITTDNLEDYLRLRPDIVIVGGGITAAPEPRVAAERIRACIDRFNGKGKE